MEENFYNWLRYWYPRGSAIHFIEDGYLVSPGLYNPHMAEFNDLPDYHCLVFLSEPGMGKTSALSNEKLKIDETIKQIGNTSIWLDLRSYGSEDRLANDLFGASEFRAWEQGASVLYLFLDSVDECLLQIETLVTLLIDKLKQCPLERLHLRLICRGASWPPFLESELIK